eukprot:2753550-Amphidinium_carterae.1
MSHGLFWGSTTVAQEYWADMLCVERIKAHPSWIRKFCSTSDPCPVIIRNSNKRNNNITRRAEVLAVSWYCSEFLFKLEACLVSFGAQL